MKETQKKSRKSTKIYTYKCVSFLFATIKLVTFELKNPDFIYNHVQTKHLLYVKVNELTSDQ